MNLDNLKKTVTKSKKRVGRGISAGQGKTAGRGTKGQNARSGKNLRPGFEGGQMPLVQRVPKKRGFKAFNLKPTTVNLRALSKMKDGDKVTQESLYKAGIISHAGEQVKIVGTEATKKLTVLVPVSKGAKEAIVKAGGKVEK